MEKPNCCWTMADVGALDVAHQVGVDAEPVRVQQVVQVELAAPAEPVLQVGVHAVQQEGDLPAPHQVLVDLELVVAPEPGRSEPATMRAATSAGTAVPLLTSTGAISYWRRRSSWTRDSSCSAGSPWPVRKPIFLCVRWSAA